MKIYDFALNWDIEVEERFIALLKDSCRKKGLSFLLINNNNVKDILKRLESHVLKISVMLDSQASYNMPKDIYAKVCYAVKDSGGAVVNDPDRARVAVDKSTAHFELINAGITTPHTIVVRNWEPNTFKLTNEERQRLSVPFIIKPAFGYGQQGVVRDAKGTIREIATARNYDRGDNFLLQEKINPVFYDGKRAWFRVIHIFDTIIPCWWDDHENRYEHVSYEHFNQFSLYQLVKIITKIASFSKMVWFSTEIAIDKKEGTRRFVAIDYVNDQCDMSTQTETVSGVPDAIVEYVASRIISITSNMPNDNSIYKKYKIFLKDATVELKGLGIPQDILRQWEAKK
jgi:hypothetical protein